MPPIKKLSATSLAVSAEAARRIDAYVAELRAGKPARSFTPAWVARGAAMVLARATPAPNRGARRAAKSAERKDLESHARKCLTFSDSELDELADELLKRIVEAAEEPDDDEPDDDDRDPAGDEEEVDEEAAAAHLASAFASAGVVLPPAVAAIASRQRIDLRGVDFRPAPGTLRLGEKPADDATRMIAQAMASKVRYR